MQRFIKEPVGPLEQQDLGKKWIQVGQQED